MNNTRTAPTWDMQTYYRGRQSLAAIFNDRNDAERAINALKDAGFKADQIGVALRDRDQQNQLVEETGTKAAKGAVSGAVGGGLLGGVVGFLVGIGALVIPGIGPVIAAGALSSALTAALGTAGATAAAGAGVGAVAGGIAGALVGMGIPEEEAKYFNQGFQRGGTLVTVNAGNRITDAAQILEQYGGDLGAKRQALS